MKKQHIVGGLLFLLLVGGIASIYFFYLKGLWEKYDQDEQSKVAWEKKLSQLEGTFENYQPEAVIAVWRDPIPDFINGLRRRINVFSMEGAFNVSDFPEGVIPKFYYEERFDKIYLDLQTYAYQKGVRIPLSTFGAPTPTELPGTWTEDMLKAELAKLTFGDWITRRLIDQKAQNINAIEIWPKRVENDGMLEKYTVGLSVTFSMESFVEFLKVIRSEPEFVSVNAFSMNNTQLRYPYGSPPLNVEMLITYARFVGAIPGSEAEMAATSVSDVMSGLEEDMDDFGYDEPVEEESGFGRWWKDFWSKYLYGG